MYLFFKRVFDMSLSIIALIVLSPLFLAIAFFIKIDSPGPIIYKGKRTAINDGVFYQYKFRTMLVDGEKKGGFTAAVNDPRFTSLGRFLRKYKLDEIPQFVNVIFGDISLVGPRPQVTHYTSQYEGDNVLILTVKPGITDLATLYFMDMDSVVGKGDVDNKYAREIEPIKNKLRLEYVKKRSFILDLKILIETIFRLFGIKGITGLLIDVK